MLDDTPNAWISKLKKIALNKSIWVWGAGNQGRGMAQSLINMGIPLQGFVDNSIEQQQQSVLCQKVLSPDTFFNGDYQKCFVIVASFFFENEITDICLRRGLSPGEDFVSYTQLKPFDYAVEVSGKCNLRCLSCPRAHGQAGHPSPGFMTLDVFKKVLDKIMAESPLVGNIQLYQWGEPLLNPQLPQIIQHANKKGIKCAVSSNLNLKTDYQQLIRSKPEWLRISCSGTGDNYEITHTGGKWDRFLGNLKEIALWRNRYHPSMKVELFYHIYRHNNGKDLSCARDICQTNGFQFHPVNAYLIGLDDVLRHSEGDALPYETRLAEEMLPIRLSEGMQLAREEKHLACSAMRCLLINADMRVSNCMMYYDREGNTAAENYLETPLAQIEDRRQKCRLCKRCQAQAMHRYCHVYWKSPVMDGAA